MSTSVLTTTCSAPSGLQKSTSMLPANSLMMATCSSVFGLRR
uniref:Uncharacterized protein n=1 Tax=Anguilla anguilla TaxID=7936 RepID=A0A0E9R475_ANGAN